MALFLLLVVLSACSDGDDLARTEPATSPTLVGDRVADDTTAKGASPGDIGPDDPVEAIRSSDTGLALDERKIRCELFSVSITEDMRDIAKTAAGQGTGAGLRSEVSGRGLVALEGSLPATLARADELDCPVGTIYGDACKNLLDAAATADGAEAEVLVTTGTAVCELGRVPIDLAPFEHSEPDAADRADTSGDNSTAATIADEATATETAADVPGTSSVKIDLRPTTGNGAGSLFIEVGLMSGWTIQEHPDLTPSRVLSRAGANRMVGQLLLDEWTGTSLDTAVPVLDGYRITADEISELAGLPARRVTATDGEIVYAQTTAIIGGWRISLGAFIDRMELPSGIETEEVPVDDILGELWLMAAALTVSSA